MLKGKKMTQRCEMYLDGPWHFSPDPGMNGEELGFWKTDYDARSWPETTVPSCFEAACPNLECYEGVCWYRRCFRTPDSWTGRRVAIQFGAVNYRCRIWLNGQLLGENCDGCLPFEFDIQDRLSTNGENFIAVEVDNAHHEGDVPGMHTGWRRFGGIIREVKLCASALCYVAQTQVIATPSEDVGNVAFDTQIRNTGRQNVAFSLNVVIHDAEGAVCATMASKSATVDAGATESVELAGSLNDLRTWSPESPNLYCASVRLVAGGLVCDGTEVSFGFRRIEATKDGLLLNGRPIFLKGFNRHEDSPHTDMAPDHELARQDLVDMKAAGANFVRLCHYPHHPKTLDMCDELGLLVFSEVPLYFWIDSDEGRRTNATRVKTAARQLERMVIRDFNHPSIIFWSVSNETRESEEEVWRSNQELIRGVRALDPTRLCVHVSDHWKKHPHFDEDDVLCINHYPSMSLAARSAIPTADLAESTENWERNLAELRALYPEKPILITEFGYVSFAGTSGHAYGEDVHSRVLEAEYAAFDEPYICGATIWCWADHAWRCGSFMGGLSVSPYGVVTRDRRKLKAYWTARSLFSPPSSG
jgi:beta-galactosidase/beta-glucuronidase